MYPILYYLFSRPRLLTLLHIRSTSNPRPARQSASQSATCSNQWGRFTRWFAWLCPGSLPPLSSPGNGSELLGNKRERVKRPERRKVRRQGGSTVVTGKKEIYPVGGASAAAVSAAAASSPEASQLYGLATKLLAASNGHTVGGSVNRRRPPRNHHSFPQSFFSQFHAQLTCWR